MAVSTQLMVILFIAFITILCVPNTVSSKIIIASLLFIPSTTQGLISGMPYNTSGILNISMVGYITIIWVISLFIFQRCKLPRKITIRIMACLLIIMSVRIAVDGIDFISNKILDNYLLPMLLALSVITSIKTKDIPGLLNFLYICIFVGAVIACVEYVVGKSLFFHEYYMKTCPWYVSIFNSSKYVAFRSCSIFGHPLTGAMYYLLGIVYLFNNERLKKNHIMFAFQLSVMIAAVLSTNSRAALLGMILYILIYLMKNRKISMLFGVVILVIGIITVLGFDELFNVYSNLYERDVLGGSLMMRVNALSSIGRIPLFSILFGDGYNDTSTTLRYLGLHGNLEISYLIILIENGIIGFLAWLSSIIFLYGRDMKRTKINGVNISSTVQGMLLIIFVVGGTSNSFGDPGTLNYIIYILLAISYILASSKEETVISNQITYRNSRQIRFTWGRNIEGGI